VIVTAQHTVSEEVVQFHNMQLSVELETFMQETTTVVRSRHALEVFRSQQHGISARILEHIGLASLLSTATNPAYESSKTSLWGKFRLPLVESERYRLWLFVCIYSAPKISLSKR
jgi:hypothetical protein